MIMRSLALKLALAFLIVGLVGAGLVAFFVGQLTQRQFNRFVVDSYETQLLDELAQHYESYGNWDGIQAALVAGPRAAPITGMAGYRRQYWTPIM